METYSQGGDIEFRCLAQGTPYMSPACKQKKLQGIDGVYVYQDDILIEGENQEEHDRRLCEVLTEEVV